MHISTVTLAVLVIIIPGLANRIFKNLPKYENIAYFEAMQRPNLSERSVYIFFWVTVFIIYLPAAKAGFVSDFTGWLDQVSNHGFWDHINRSNYKVKSFYQFTQLVTYVFYKLFGIHEWLWHLLFVTLHATNSWLIYRFFKLVFGDSGIDNGASIAFGGSLLFCVSPYASEVVVWEPSFHYLQGLLLIMVILILARNYLHEPLRRHAWIAVILFALSTFSLEFFFLAPLLVLLLIFYYRTAIKTDRQHTKKAFLYFFLPITVLLVLRIVGFWLLYHDWVSRIGSTTLQQSFGEYITKAGYYIYHVLFLGRFFPQEIRQRIYDKLAFPKAVVAFSGLLAVACFFIAFCYKRMTVKAKAGCWIFACALVCLALILPVWFPKTDLITMDRYTYVFNAFCYMLLVLLISYVPSLYLKTTILSCFAILSIFFTLKLNLIWKDSAAIIHNLINSVPDPGNRTIIVLNLPQNMRGAPMISASKESELKLLHNLLLKTKLNGKVYDAEGYNMLTADDGAHVNVQNDSLVKVTLNQWGTWWIYEDRGALSYENEDYRINMVDQGHWYELVLKKPASGYVLLYQVGDRWKVVNWNKKNADQE
jgi:hypothetical protein